MSEEKKLQEDIQLADVPLFRSIPKEKLEQFERNLKTLNVPAGGLILEEGKLGNEFFFVLNGQVEVIRAMGTAEQSHLGMRMAGDFIGEMGLLGQGAPRTATVQAVTDTRLLVVTYEDFTVLLQAHPELGYEMASVISERLTEALNHTIRYLRERNEKLEQAYDELKAAQAQIVEKEKLELSLQMARKIQFSILPTKLPQLQGYDIGALMEPAQAVGGDFYDVQPLDDENVVLVVGDVSDKGMPAAIFMAQCHALLRASMQMGQSAKNVIERVNRLLLGMNAEEMFVTLIYGILHLPSGEFRYTRAGHELPMILDVNGEVTFPQPGTGTVLGVWGNAWLEDQTIIIPKEGCMILYSDGVTDARNPDSTRFGEERFVELVKRFGLSKSAQETCQMIFETLSNLRSGVVRYDDITLMAIKRVALP